MACACCACDCRQGATLTALALSGEHYDGLGRLQVVDDGIARVEGRHHVRRVTACEVHCRGDTVFWTTKHNRHTERERESVSISEYFDKFSPTGGLQLLSNLKDKPEQTNLAFLVYFRHHLA